MDKQLMIDILGWAGSALVIIAYASISMGKMATTAKSFQWMNLLGSICLIVNTLYYGALPSAFVNVVWLGIAGYALVKANLVSNKQ